MEERIKDAKESLDNHGLKTEVEGTIDEIKGKARSAVAGVTGDTTEQIKGEAEQLKGKAKQLFGQAEQAISDKI